MMLYKITPEDRGLLIEFFTKPVPLFIRATLLTLIVICAAIPIVIMAFADAESPLAYIFSMVIFWLPGFFLLRVFLWNSYGREVVSVSAGRVNYFCDFRFFQDRKMSFEMEALDFGFVEDRTEKLFMPLRNDMAELLDDEQMIGYLQLKTPAGALNFSMELTPGDVSRLQEEVNHTRSNRDINHSI